MTTIKTLLLSTIMVAALPRIAAFAAPPDGTLLVDFSADASTFDPAQISSRDNANIARHMFRTLYEGLADADTVPNLAMSYVVSEDGRDYTHTLAEGLTCEDGEPLTAEDVA